MSFTNHTAGNTGCNTCSGTPLSTAATFENKFEENRSNELRDFVNGPGKVEDWYEVLTKSPPLLFESVVRVADAMGTLILGSAKTIADLVTSMAKAAQGKYTVTRAGEEALIDLFTNIRLTFISEPSAAIVRTSEPALIGTTLVPQNVLRVLAAFSVPSAAAS